MRVLITGGCGFIGSTLAKRLTLQEGIAVRVLDNEVCGRREALRGVAHEFVSGDIRDRAVLDAAMVDVDAVVHLAADTGVIGSIRDPVLNFDVNVRGSFNILEAMRAAGVNRIVSASTGGAILGDVQPPVHEEMVARPLSPYGASKLTVEGYCSAYAASYGFEAVSLRFSNVYGPGSLHKGSAVATFCRNILNGCPIEVFGDGEQTRDFIFVDDLCAGIATAVKGKACGVIQLGSGQPLSVNDLLRHLGKVVRPYPISVIHHPPRSGEVRATWCDINRASRELAFCAPTPLSVGLARTWRWFLDQRVHAGGNQAQDWPKANVA